jgi:serine/threonine protein kinase/tetratricopeptide (TPR) repeat protein
MCPSEQDLRRYVNEELGEADLAAIEAHLEQDCPRCLEVLEAMEDPNAGGIANALIRQPRVPRRPRSPAADSTPDPARADRPGAEMAPKDAPRPIAEGPGSRIGPYKLLQEIGEGAFGVVFMAEQQVPVHRLVALKVIKPGMDSKQVIARFETERQALALMDHPNIAKVFDAGTTEFGRPYFVMELIRGVPITKYCDEHHLRPKERLELFQTVCRAVQHAHQKGIIHRDLKPSNVLVAEYDNQRVAKVIDFGVAKATGPKLTQRTLFTEFNAVVGTLAYMSPEQAKFNALDIDTRSDVYALGALLYELLTGTTPFDKNRLRQAAFDEVLQIIRQEEPPKPSTRLSTAEGLPSIAANRGLEPRKLSGLVRRELDWIVMRALEKDRTRRYETANGLARDIERYLAGDPVEAGPPSAGYRLRKFARKHRAAVTVVTLFSALLVASVLVVTVLAIRAQRAGSLAKQALTQVNTEQEKTKAALAAKTDALQKASVALAAETKANAEAKEQRARAEARGQLAIDAVKKFRDAVTANPELKNRPELDALRKALLKEPLEFFRKLRDQFHADHDTRPAALVGLANANFELAATTAEIGSIPDAIESYTQSVAILQRVVSEDPTLTVYLAHSLNNIGNLLSKTGRVVDALESYKRALEIRERLVREHPTVTKFQVDLAGNLNNVGLMLGATGHAAEALEPFQRTLEIFERLVSENPAVTEYQSDLAKSLNNIGGLLREAGNAAEALESYKRALEISERLVREHPAVTEYQSDLAKSLNNIGVLLRATGHAAEALESFQRPLEIFERLVREHPTVTEYQADLAKNLFNIGVLLCDTSHAAEALESYKRALPIGERLVREHPTVTEYQSDLAGSLHNIGVLLRDTGHAAEALDLVSAGAGDLPTAGARASCRHRVPERPSQEAHQHRRTAEGHGPCGRGPRIIPASASGQRAAGARASHRHRVSEGPSREPRRRRRPAK